MDASVRTLNTRLDIAGRLVGHLRAADLEAELEAIRTGFALGVGPLLAPRGEHEQTFAREAFRYAVAAEDTQGALDRLIARARSVVAARDAETRGQRGGSSAREAVRAMQQLLDQYSAQGGGRPRPPLKTGYGFCAECGVDMDVDAERSALVCPGCGEVRELVGAVFEASQYYSQEGQKAKSGTFNPNRHFWHWMERILARESQEELGDPADPDNICGEKLLAALCEIARRDRKIPRFLTVDDVRAMLSELGKTNLNKNVPLIMRSLTGCGPPDLSDEVCQHVEKLFCAAIEAGEKIRARGSGRVNRNYYPYYIYKILDSVLPRDAPPRGGEDPRRVLYYIYMQGQDTLDKNDQEWLEITRAVPGLVWTPTDRTEALKYRPS